MTVKLKAYAISMASSRAGSMAGPSLLATADEVIE
jgi:hypothetical protein